jgi:vitamin B12 transporter
MMRDAPVCSTVCGNRLGQSAAGSSSKSRGFQQSSYGETNVFRRTPIRILGGVLMLSPSLVQADSLTLQEVIITATKRADVRQQIPNTVQVLNQETIEASNAKSMTDLLAENSVGFFSQWTPAQTSINLRGAASDGQGRDFRGQVSVLIDGRRAGTANLSKLSISDVARVEVLRGPASVIYGSQSLGGVINLITRDGQTQERRELTASAGSWGLAQGHLAIPWRNDSSAFYLGLSSGTRDDYESGRGSTMKNTAWERWGVLVNANHRLDTGAQVSVAARTDGIWNAGFRGSGGNLFSTDNRRNSSADLRVSFPLSTMVVDLHTYVVRDVDDFRWASPVIRSAQGATVAGTSRDENYRVLDIAGAKLALDKVWSERNKTLFGIDAERSQLDSTRSRVGVGGAVLSQISPQDNNQTDRFVAAYLEHLAIFDDGRFTWRSGARTTKGDMRFDETPNLALQRSRSVGYESTTWSTGITYRVLPNWVVRANAGTGFRTPTATELAADFTALGGGRSFGNPDLRPERSQQWEAGLLWSDDRHSIDLVLFENRIIDRIIIVPRAGVANTGDYANNTAEIVVRAIEGQGRFVLGEPTDRSRWVLNLQGMKALEMRDRGASATSNTSKPQRMYEYQAGGTLRHEHGKWSASIGAVLRGPMWYDTEENLLVPAGEVNRNFIHRKAPFWTVNLRSEYRVNDSLEVVAAIENMFDKNEHPIFIAIDEEPSIADLRFYNGAAGTSMPGREFSVGVKLRF